MGSQINSLSEIKKSPLKSVTIIYILGFLGIFLACFIYLGFKYLTATVNPPEISIVVTPSNTEKEWVTKYGGIRYPRVEEDGDNYSVNFATYFDKICIGVRKNPGGEHDYAGFSLEVGGHEVEEPSKCWTWQELQSDVNKEKGWTATAVEKKQGFFESLLGNSYEPGRTITIKAKNRAGTVTKTISANWLEGCAGYSLNYDQENHYTKCDERAEDNYKHVHGKNSEAYKKYEEKNKKPSSTTNSPNNSTSKPTVNPITSQKTPNGLTYSAALNTCRRRVEQDYEFSSDLAAEISGNTWKFEIEALHEDYYTAVMDIQCHVSGTNSAPYITYYYEDVALEYIYDNGYAEPCYYGHDPAGGCR